MVSFSERNQIYIYIYKFDIWIQFNFFVELTQAHPTQWNNLALCHWLISQRFNYKKTELKITDRIDRQNNKTIKNFF